MHRGFSSRRESEVTLTAWRLTPDWSTHRELGDRKEIKQRAKPWDVIIVHRTQRVFPARPKLAEGSIGCFGDRRVTGETERSKLSVY